MSVVSWHDPFQQRTTDRASTKLNSEQLMVSQDIEYHFA